MKLHFSTCWIILALGVSSCSTGHSVQNFRTDSMQISESSKLEEGCQPFDNSIEELVSARADFNHAIFNANIDAISPILADNVILITGTDSNVFIGRDAQLGIWKQDFADDERLVYVRTPNCISMSGIFPIAIERGSWRGAKEGDMQNHVSGEYSAKWREVDGQWMIEIETYLTTSCGGLLCPEKMTEQP